MTITAEPTARMGKRARAKEANRRAILDAAGTVFARIGYEAANIRDIIRETDLASGTFYNYFKSKEEVFEAIANDSVLRIRPLLRQAHEAASDLNSYLLAAYGAYFNFLAEENNQKIKVSSNNQSNLSQKKNNQKKLERVNNQKNNRKDRNKNNPNLLRENHSKVPPVTSRTGKQSNLIHHK